VVAEFLRHGSALRFDYASNVTGVDWLDAVVKKIIKVKQVIDDVEKEVDQAVEEKRNPAILRSFIIFIQWN